MHQWYVGSCWEYDCPALINDATEYTHKLVSALAKAYRWQGQLESGEYVGLEDLAAANGVDRTYVGRILRLTALSPDIVERILDGDEPRGA